MAGRDAVWIFAGLERGIDYAPCLVSLLLGFFNINFHRFRCAVIFGNQTEERDADFPSCVFWSRLQPGAAAPAQRAAGLIHHGGAPARRKYTDNASERPSQRRGNHRRWVKSSQIPWRRLRRRLLAANGAT